MHALGALLLLWERQIATIPEWLPRPRTQRTWRNAEGHFSLVSRTFQILGGSAENKINKWALIRHRSLLRCPEIQMCAGDECQHLFFIFSSDTIT